MRTTWPVLHHFLVYFPQKYYIPIQNTNQLPIRIKISRHNVALVSVPSHGRFVGIIIIIIIIIIISAKMKYQVRVASYDTNFTKIQV